MFPCFFSFRTVYRMEWTMATPKHCTVYMAPYFDRSFHFRKMKCVTIENVENQLSDSKVTVNKKKTKTIYIFTSF